MNQLGKSFRNKYTLQGKTQIWKYNGGCQYESEYHKGKVEWHHPCSKHSEIGLWLCEGHHSILQGREKRYIGETSLNKTLKEMKKEIEELVENIVLESGLTLKDIDKG